MSESPLSREAVRELDRRAIEEYGIPSIVLMENAGRACTEVVRSVMPPASRAPVVIVIGPGNNGGDGLVIARTLYNTDCPVSLLFVGPRSKLVDSTPDFATNLALWRRLGREVEVLETPEEVESRAAQLSEAAVLVDAMFGTGLTRELDSPYLEMVELFEGANRPVVSVDVPSGLDANTGELLGACVRADVTVTFVAPKLGFVRGAGPHHVGRVVTAEIGIPRDMLRAVSG